MKFLLTFSILIISFRSLSQQPNQLTSDEEDCHAVFSNFKLYITKSIANDAQVLDTANLKYVLLNFVFSGSRLDSLDKIHIKPGEMSTKQLAGFYEQFRRFYNFFLERNDIQLIQHLAAIPVRLYSDRCIYEKLTSFQKENTLVYYDDRKPEQLLGYMLFVPKLKDRLVFSRIWSWTLVFESGLWAFKAVTGEVGMEYLFSDGIKPPKPENVIK